MQPTPDYLENLESCEIPYLDIFSKTFRLVSYNNDSYKTDKDTLFQILIIDDKCEIKLVYGNKGFFEAHYNGIDTKNLPTKGAIVDQDFAKKEDDNYPLIRHLLQSRRLCQMIASTWIDFDKFDKKADNTFPAQVKYAKKIFDCYNIDPCTYWGKRKEASTTIEEMTSTVDLLRKLLDEDTVENTKFLIKPGSVGYSSISLALLLSGQAYYVDKVEKNKLCLKKIWEPILSTYEIVYGYAMGLCWDTFYGTISEISQAGNKQKLPLSKITLGYPPKPSEFNVKEENIQVWSLAPEHEDEEEVQDTIKQEKYPFYPPKNSAEWEKQIPKFIVPPFPYIPLSSL